MTNEEETAVLIAEMRLAGIPASYIGWVRKQYCDEGDHATFVKAARNRLAWWNNVDDQYDQEWRQEVLRVHK